MMSTEEKTSKSVSRGKNDNITAKLFLAIDDLAFALALETDEKVKNSAVYKSAQEVIKIVYEIRKRGKDVTVEQASETDGK